MFRLQHLVELEKCYKLKGLPQLLLNKQIGGSPDCSIEPHCSYGTKSDIWVITSLCIMNCMASPGN